MPSKEVVYPRMPSNKEVVDIVPTTVRTATTLTPQEYSAKLKARWQHEIAEHDKWWRALMEQELLEIEAAFAEIEKQIQQLDSYCTDLREARDQILAEITVFYDGLIKQEVDAYNYYEGERREAERTAKRKRRQGIIKGVVGSVAGFALGSFIGAKFSLSGAKLAVVSGATGGLVSSAVTGSNVIEGAIKGAVFAGFDHGIGNFLVGKEILEGTITHTAFRAAANSGIHTAVYGGNPLLNLASSVGASVAGFAVFKDVNVQQNIMAAVAKAGFSASVAASIGGQDIAQSVAIATMNSVGQTLVTTAITAPQAKASNIVKTANPKDQLDVPFLSPASNSLPIQFVGATQDVAVPIAQSSPAPKETAVKPASNAPVNAKPKVNSQASTSVQEDRIVVARKAPGVFERLAGATLDFFISPAGAAEFEESLSNKAKPSISFAPNSETALVANGFTDITTRKSKIATFWEDVSRDAEESSTEFWHHAASNKTQAKMLAGSVVGVSERVVDYAVAPFKLMGSVVASVNEFESSFNSDILTDRSDYNRQMLLFKYQAQHDGVKATARDFWGAVTSPVTTGFTATHNFGRGVFNVVQDSRTNPFTSGRAAGHFAVDSSTLLFSGTAAVRAAGKVARLPFASGQINLFGPALDGSLYPTSKLPMLVKFLEKRGVHVYGTNGAPCFIGKKNGPSQIYLPEKPTILQVKHELSHWLDFRELGFTEYARLSTYQREKLVLERLQSNRIWHGLNQYEKDFSINYVEKIRNGYKPGGF